MWINPFLQLGLRYTITTLSKLPQPSRLLEEHFVEKVGKRGCPVLSC
jgi:hypothetical protein